VLPRALSHCEIKIVVRLPPEDRLAPRGHRRGA
jgi:hypothetical protein